MTKKPASSPANASPAKSASDAAAGRTSPADEAGASKDKGGKDSKAGKSSKAGKTGKGIGTPSLAAAIADFRVDAPELSPLIEERAYGSGGYPYADRPKRKSYEKDLHALQIELLKLQEWVKATRERVVIVFEGRDAAGKGGTIQRLVQHLNPRFVRIVALDKPSSIEAAQWYFQRYVAHMPPRGEIAIFDRSWYNRAVIEPVMGFCTPAETAHFLEQVPAFEKILLDDGIRLFKIWLDVGREMQLTRLYARYRDPLKRWKLSPVDLAAPARWDAISAARNAMFLASQEPAPWTVVLANDKMRTRLGVIRQILAQIPYEGRDDRVVAIPDPAIVLDGRDFLARPGMATP
ncbi:polyphosphate kinase 2 [Ancylobacter sp. TS-1]|uniref:polyphosphate kinase 2 n=1 Tax=Ancylobacter sp. TS-1 TaxID=1850374 RepID=UPI001265D60C|nr:polyphosphate kinase 2 [Ancylobacter sp. TS-1]QFR34133.1 polyphosphate kinase 2 [Ancylobacter sp. TS-1]